MTNYEKIKAMSIEEMASEFAPFKICFFCTQYWIYPCCDGECKKHIKEWLESEAEDNG